MNRLTWVPLYTLMRREVARFLRVAVQTVVTPLVNSGLYLMIFGVSLGQRINFKEGLPYLAFLIPGLIMLGCLNNAFQNSSSSIITSKFGGDLEDLKVAPLSHWQIVLALSLAGLVRGAIVALVTSVACELAYYAVFGQLLWAQHFFILAAFIALGGLTFANLGISVGFWAKSFDQLSAVGGFVLLPLIYLGGVFFSVEHLPPMWQSVALANPLLYLINGTRFGLLGQCDVNIWVAGWVALGSFLFTGALALLSLRKGSFHRW